MFEVPPNKSKTDFLALTEEQKDALTDEDARDYMFGGTLGDHLQWPRIRDDSATAREAIERMLHIRKNL